MIKKIKLKDSIGTLLAHDITEIKPGKLKRVAFNKGHKIIKDDLHHLSKLGKEHLFVIDLNNNHDHIHENTAVLELAKALSGPGIKFDPKPLEGKVQLKAKYDGLFKINIKTLVSLNIIPEIICASIHTNTPVTKNIKLANTKIIPLFIHKKILSSAINLIHKQKPIFKIKPFKYLKARLIITGNEIYNGLIKDGFEILIKNKLKHYNASLIETIILPDNVNRITSQVLRYLKLNTDILITSGGMSVDPDDVVRHAIEQAGPNISYYGASAFPGTMFQLSYFKKTPVIGIPACALYNKITIFDLILPRILVGERLNDKDLASFAHGGMCKDCTSCNYPNCSFGKI